MKFSDFGPLFQLYEKELNKFKHLVPQEVIGEAKLIEDMIFKSEGSFGEEFKNFRDIGIVKKVEKGLIKLFYSIFFQSLLAGENIDTYVDLLLSKAAEMIKEKGLDPVDLR